MFSTLRTRGLVKTAQQKRAFSLAAPVQSQGILGSLFNKSNMPEVPLDETFPGVAEGTLTEGKSGSDAVQTSTMANGVKVVSVDGSSPITSVGAFIDSGSRYENPTIQGINSFMETIAFKSTPSRSDMRLVREMLAIGCNVSCSASREHMTYMGESAREYAHEVVGTLGDVIQNNEFDAGELKEGIEAYKAANERKTGAPDIQIMESIHAAGYYNNTVGLPFLAYDSNLDYFANGDTLRSFRDHFFTANNMVVAGVGIEHDYLCQLVESEFGHMAKGDDTKDVAQKANYTGGDQRIFRHDEPLVHVALAFETANWHHADLVPMCVLQMMMGGGGSFSAGGPGKGMYSRLYTSVMNRYNWVESVTCFNSIFADSAIFGLYGTTSPHAAGDLTAVMLDEATKMAGDVDATELARAKNQLKTAVQMHLDQRALRMEDIGRQMLTYGKVESAAEIVAKIDKVTDADIKRVASAMLKTPISVAAVGDTTHVPRYDQIAAQLKA